MERRLLPIGTVVHLKESNSRVLIAGYLPVTRSQPDYVWDYSGFLFPVGYVNNEEIYCFNNEQIDSVVQYGFRNYEWDAFMNDLEPAIDKIKEAKKEEA